MLNVFRRNFGLKVLSLSLAIAAWAYFRFAANPVIAAHFDQQLSVPIAVTGLHTGNVARFTEKQALVTITTPRDGSAVKPEEVRAVVNLQDRGPGVYNVPVEVVAENLAIKALSPASINVSVEPLGERTIPVSITYVGQQKNGIVANSPQISPQSVTVTGTATDLARIDSARIELPFAGTPSRYDAMVRPALLDGHGGIVANVDTSPNLVRVQVNFQKSSEVK